MKKTSAANRYFSLLAGMILTLTVVTMLTPATARAANTSANATVHNPVTVSFKVGTGGATFNNYAFVNVTVATKGATPTVYPATGITTTASTSVSYDSGFKSNSNGPDTYTLSVPTITENAFITDNGVPTVSPASVTLWGGITSAASGAGYIVVPAGSTTGLAAGNIVQIGSDRYTVGTIVPGTPASTNTTTGVTTAETPAQIPLTPLLGTEPLITAGSVPAGTQVGQFVNETSFLTFTTGALLSQANNGTHTATFSAAPTATDEANAAVAAGTATNVTTVTPINLTITKKYRKLNNVGAGAFDCSSPAAVTPASYDNTGSPKPGEMIEYLITVENQNATQAASLVNVIDAIPPYTTYVASTTCAGIGTTLSTVADAAGTSQLIPANGGVAIGTLNATATAYVVFRVTVD